MRIARCALLLLATPMLVAPVAADGPNLDLSTYFLFALDELRSKGITATGGNIGVNDGSISMPLGALDAPTSEITADSVRIPTTSACTRLFANDMQRTGPSCQPGAPFSSPIMSDVATACGFPSPFPDCDDRAPVNIRLGQIEMLHPGAYGDVRVMGGAGKSAMLVLPSGTYDFCSLTTGRGAELLFDGPAKVNVRGFLELGTGTFTGPVPSSGISAREIEFFANGASVHFSRRAEVHACLCAPDAGLRVTSGARLDGTFVARAIGTERMAGGIPTTTSTTTSTTSSTSTTESTSSTSMSTVTTSTSTTSTSIGTLPTTTSSTSSTTTPTTSTTTTTRVC
ncbi:MAG TPA: hypothetical protein VEM57_07020 [Candidatus Binatus sp.]|nr:hypothetical protein [Candidatus Binatus sp.]